MNMSYGKNNGFNCLELQQQIFADVNNSTETDLALPVLDEIENSGSSCS